MYSREEMEAWCTPELSAEHATTAAMFRQLLASEERLRVGLVRIRDVGDEPYDSSIDDLYEYCKGVASEALNGKA